MQLQPGIESSQKRFDALCFFQIVKERNSPGSKARRQNTLPCSRAWVPLWRGGGERDRTDDLLLAKQALSQLSYTPRPAWESETLVGLVGFEPTTPALSRRCSNRLSYRPEKDRPAEALDLPGHSPILP
jgi:hypothetical protein